MVVARYMEGKFRSYRLYVRYALYTIFVSIPWFHWNGNSILRLDIPARRFYLLGHIFAPQEGVFLMLFLFTMGLSLFFFTSLIGRVWCGWACPQTVFTNLFDWIGRKILDTKYGKPDAPAAKKIILHGAWIVASIFFSFVWISYFVDPLKMVADIQVWSQADASWPYFVAFFATTLYLDMSLVREQFCKYACPYARFQTVLMDQNSVNVTYDYKRGEPRRQTGQKVGEHEGDCTACNLCLVTCPTGIDIREGLNIGCIACAQCVDACEKTMGKLGKESLIRYISQNQADEPGSKIKWLRPRTVVYGSLLVVIFIVTMVLLQLRIPFYVKIIPDRNIQPVALEGGMIRNVYEMDLQNLTLEDKKFKVQLGSDDENGSDVKIAGDEDGEMSFTVPANGNQVTRFVVEYNPKPKEVYKKFQIVVTNEMGQKRVAKVPFRFPDQVQPGISGGGR